MTGVARGTGTTYPLRAAEFTPRCLVVFVLHHLYLCNVLWIVVCSSVLPFDDFRVLSAPLWYVETVLRTEERRLGTDLDMQ